ncbi:MAG: hypothetical protein ABI261_06075 [Ginsengibacter sp.]
MKIKITILFSLLLFATTTIFAQDVRNRSVSERVKITMDKITSTLKLDASQASRTDSAFADFYQSQNKLMENAKASGNRPNRQNFEKIISSRDEKLKEIFTEDQYTKFKNEVEDSLRPYWQSHEGN